MLIKEGKPCSNLNSIIVLYQWLVCDFETLPYWIMVSLQLSLSNAAQGLWTCDFQETSL